MVGGRTVFEILRTEQDPAADAALLAALQDADPPVAQAIVETILSRNTKEGLIGLVQHFHLLDESLRQAVLIDWERLFSVLREAAQSRHDQTRVNVLEIIRRARIYRAAYLVETALRHRASKVRAAASTTLCFLADELLRTAPAHLSNSDLESMTPEQIHQEMADLESYAEDRRQVVSSIEAALSCFEVHHQAQVVEAALWFVDEMSQTFWALMNAQGSRIAQAAVQLLQKGITPRLVPFAMTALNSSELRPNVLRAFAAGGDLALLEEWLRQSWRLVQPKTARAMNCLKQLACAGEFGRELFLLPPRSHRHLPHWIASTSMAPRDKVELLQEVLHRGDRDTKRAVLWALGSMPDVPVNEMLRNFHCPEDPEVEQLARLDLARRCPLEAPLSRLLAGKAWAQSLGRTPRPQAITFDRYWAAFDGLREEQKLELGRQMLECTPLLKSMLGRRLSSPELGERVRAIRVISTLELADKFQEHLYQLCHDPRSEVRSAAVAALAPLNNAVSRRLAHNALQDEDARVQANAVETMVALGHESLADELLAKLSSPDNRVQANAVKALLKLGVREAAETLLRMLKHENRLHRISALWLIERMGLFTVASKVAAMAADDPDPAIRRRAGSLAGNIPAGLRRFPSGPPAQEPAKASAELASEVQVS